MLQNDPASQSAGIYDLSQNKLFVLEVGAEKKTFTIHKQFLESSSEFFRCAINGNFKGAIEGRMSLPTYEALILNIYLNWIYGKRTLHLADKPDLAKDEEDTAHARRWLVDLRLIIINDTMQNSEFHNAHMDHALDAIGREDAGPASLASFVFENTAESSPLRKLIVDLHACFLTPDTGLEDWRHGQAELWREVAHRLQRFTAKLGDSRWKQLYYTRP